MTAHARLLGIVVALSWLGLSAASAAGGTSKDTWKGAWKFEIDRQDQPWLGFYETTGKTVFRIGCGAHFEIDAVYPGGAPKQDHTKASITIANGKTQMDFAGFTYAGPESFPPNTSMFNQPDLGYPELDEDKWRALENRVFRSSGLRAAADDLGATCCRRPRCRAGGRASRKSADAPTASRPRSGALLLRGAGSSRDLGQL